MDETNELHFDCLCRTCMHQVSAANVDDDVLVKEQPGRHRRRWQSIFHTIEECGAMCIAEVLTSTMPLLKVQLCDDLPKQICDECLEHLIRAYHFQQMCLRAEQKMRDFLNKKHAETKVTTRETIEAEAVVEISTKAFQMHNEEQRILIEPVNNLLPEKATMLIDDPLQSVSAGAIDLGNDAQIGVSKCLKKELDNDDESNEYDGYDYTIDDTLKIESVKTTAKQEPAERGDGSDSDTHSNWLSKTSEKRDIRRSTFQAGVKAKKLHYGREGQAGLTSSTTHTCTSCNKNFNARRYLLRHLRRHKKVDGQTNMYTNQPGSDVQQDQHIRLQCNICARQYNKPESLYKHRLTHDNEKESEPEKHSTNFICDLCDKVYGSQRTLTRHKRQRHSTAHIMLEAKNLYTCKFCNKSFQQCGTLKDHLRTHTGEQPYLCSECGRAFNSASNMKQHLLRHTGLKRYECPDCPKRFPCLSDLSSHKAVHRRIKPHVCDICGSAFGKPYLLKKHKMYHNGEKPYKCEYCEMRFVCMDHQRRHMRTHTGEKPYKCKYCERAFAQSNDLIKHLRTHLGENVYKCELCPSAYRLAAELRAHFAIHKNEDMETRERNMKALIEEEAKLRLNLETKYIKGTAPVDTYLSA